jgi:hypothetical protein
MNFLAGCLLLFLHDPARAFAAMVLLLRNRQLRGLYTQVSW